MRITGNANRMAFIVTAVSVMFASCSENPIEYPSGNESSTERRVETNGVESAGMLSKVGGSVYGITVSPSNSNIRIGDCLYFTGVATLNNKPVKALSIGVDDPIKEQSLGKAAVTDSYGRFTYYTENMCPARYNSKAGRFRFTFYAGTAKATSTVTVSLVQPSGSREISVKNTSAKTYKVRVVVDGADKGTSTIKSRQAMSLWKDAKFATTSLSAYVMDANGKNLWNATYTWKPTYTAGSSTFLNPKYSNFNFNASTKVNGRQRNYNFLGTARTVYDNVINQQVAVGGASFNVIDGTWMGINYNAGGSISGPGCTTFLGFKASCSVESTTFSAGLQLCLGGGEGLALGPFKVEPGPSVSCCVQVASAQCQIMSAEASISATIK